MDKFSRSDPPSQTAFPVASAGYPFILVAAFTTAILALLGFTTLTLIGLVITFCICGFFRDPDRVTPVDKGVVVSPADGKVIAAGLVDNSPFSNGEFMKISIFMSVFNVHVNRVPYNGRVKEIDYYPGKFFSANLDKASEQNEHNAVSIEMETGQPLCDCPTYHLLYKAGGSSDSRPAIRSYLLWLAARCIFAGRHKTKISCGRQS